MTVVGAVVVAVLLPRERKFVRSEGLLASARQMLRHFRNPQLLATYAVGFGVLFNFICTFTYISFRLAAPPYNLSPTLARRASSSSISPAPVLAPLDRRASSAASAGGSFVRAGDRASGSSASR